MIRKISTKNSQPDLSSMLSNDLLLVLASFVAGLVIPFLVWLWAIRLLAQVILAQTI